MKTLSDNELAGEIKKSNKKALETFYFRYYKMLFHFTVSRLQDSESAKEIIQEIFKRLWQNRKNINTKKSIKDYIFRIANNLIIDHYRKKQVQNTYFDRSEELPETQSDEDLEFKAQFNMAMDKLPEDCRTVFTLHYIKRYTFLEIAEMCFVSKKTVEKRIKKAIDILRKQLV
ncbi:MAG: sigma-70 family RNA polymerase sigma factor [Calditrichaceae bacterium]